MALIGDALSAFALVVDAAKAGVDWRRGRWDAAWQRAVTYLLERCPEFCACTRADLDRIRRQPNVVLAARKFRETGSPDELRRALEGTLGRYVQLGLVRRATDLLLDRVRIEAANDPKAASLFLDKLAELEGRIDEALVRPRLSDRAPSDSVIGLHRNHRAP